MAKTNNPYSTVKVLKRDLKLLKQVSLFTGISESQIIKDFIVKLWMSTNQNFQKCIETGLFLGFEVNIESRVKNPTVSGQYQTAMDTPQAETDKKNEELASEQFSKLDATFEDRRKNLRKWCWENE